MFRFSSVLIASIVGGAYASNPSLAGYEPATTVTDHAGIAGDQAVIEEYCGFGDSPGMDAARQVYQNGGHSKSVAFLTLASPLANSISKDTELSATSVSGATVIGKALSDYAQNSQTIGFQYTTSDDPTEYVGCQVGGLPEKDQKTTGCLAANGTVTISGSTPQEYISVENGNDRTLQKFSTGANPRFKPGDDINADYFGFFDPYLAYFGSSFPDFGDKIAMSAFNNTPASFDNGVSVNMYTYGFDARCQIAKKTTAYIIALLYAQREMYDAIYDCTQDCATDACNDDAVHALDEAVAFYVGNLVSSDSEGNLGYALAEKRCENFGTCVNVLEGQSNVNKNIMAKFNELKSLFASRQCENTQAGIDEIIRLMMIPLIQGTLRYAYLTSSDENPTEEMQAEGFVFALGILPQVHKCDAQAAATIYDNMAFKEGKNTKADFAQVKSAFESVYGCLKISCGEVGGLVDTSTKNTYYQGAAPCGGVDSLAAIRSSASASSLSMMGSFAAVAAALMM
ncbi:hypothetical protein ACA910_012762 [Epithemia clementina (nom. ined.)]